MSYGLCKVIEENSLILQYDRGIGTVLMAVLENVCIWGREPAAYGRAVLRGRTDDSSNFKPFPKHSYPESETSINGRALR